LTAIITGKQNTAALTFKSLLSGLLSPANYRQATASPAALFLVIFILQKKFSETAFTKLQANSLQKRVPADFTNYFSVICLFSQV
jgi:hypothetical protein